MLPRYCTQLGAAFSPPRGHFVVVFGWRLSRGGGVRHGLFGMVETGNLSDFVHTSPISSPYFLNGDTCSSVFLVTSCLELLSEGLFVAGMDWALLERNGPGPS